MSDTINKTVSKQIFEYCEEYQKYEEYVRKCSSSNKKTNGKGYLIEKDLMQKWKISNFYEDIKTNMKYGYKNSEKLIEKKEKWYKMDIIATKFRNKQHLIDDISNNKEYQLITSDLWVKICNRNKKNEEGISYMIENKKISLIFNNNEKIFFKIEDEFLISKSKLIECEEKNLNNNGKEKKEENKIENINKENTKAINNNNKNEEEKNNPISEKFIKEKLILIKLYFFKKELKMQSENEQKLNDEINMKFYLIPKNWLNKFKEVFFFPELKKYISTNKGNKIEDILMNLPGPYKAKINEIKDLKCLQDMEFKYEIVIKKISEGKELKYISDFELINNELFDLLIREKYFHNIDIKYIKQCELYKINEKYILNFNQEEKEFKDMIIYFDENNNFVEEFLLSFNEGIEIKSNLIKEMKIDFKEKNNKNCYKIVDKQNNVIGLCYKIKEETIKIENKISEEKNKENNSVDFININTNHDQNNKKNGDELKNNAEEIINLTTKEVTNSTINDDRDEKNFFLKNEKEIEILISIYFFQKELKEALKKENIEKYKGIIINKIWLDKFNTIFMYNKINEILENKNIKEKKKAKDEIINFYNSLDQQEKTNIESEKQNLKDIKLVPNFKKLNENNNISYPESFYLINKAIYDKIQEIITGEKLYNILESNCYFINNGKIILKYESIKLEENKLISNKVLITKLNEDCVLVPEMLLVYNEDIDEKNPFFDRIFCVKNTKYNLDMQEKEIKINGKIIGNIYKLIYNKASNEKDIIDINNNSQNNTLKNSKNFKIIEGLGDKNLDKSDELTSNSKKEEFDKELINDSNNNNENEKETFENLEIKEEYNFYKSKNEKESLKKGKLTNNIDEKKINNNFKMDNTLIRNELNDNTKKDLMALINYLKFKIDLKNKIEQSKKGKIFSGQKNENYTIYLVDERWMNEIKKFYNYDLIK